MRILTLVMLLVLSEADYRDAEVHEVTENEEDAITNAQDNTLEEARTSIIEILGSLVMVDNETFLAEQKGNYTQGKDGITQLLNLPFGGQKRDYTLDGEGIMQLLKDFGKKFLVVNQGKLADIKANRTVLEDNEATLADNTTRDLPKEASDLGKMTKILMYFFPNLKETMKAQYGTYMYLENHISKIFTYLEEDLAPKIIEHGVTASLAAVVPIKGWVDGSATFFQGLNETVTAAMRLIKLSWKGAGVHVLEGHPDKITEALKRRMGLDVGEGAWKIGRGALKFFTSTSAPYIEVLLDVFEEIVKMVDFVFQRLVLSLKIHDAQQALLPENSNDPKSILNNEASFGKWFADTVFYLPITAALSFIPKKVRSPFAFCEVLISQEEYTGKNRLITKDEYMDCSGYVKELASYVPDYLEKFGARYSMTFTSSIPLYEAAIESAMKNEMKKVEMSPDLSYGTMVNKYTNYAIVDIEIEEVVVRSKKNGGKKNWDSGTDPDFYGYVTNYKGAFKNEGNAGYVTKYKGPALSFSCPENKVFSNGLCFDQNGENAMKVVSEEDRNQKETWIISKFNGEKIDVMYRKDVIPSERKVYLEIWDWDNNPDDFAGGVPLDLEALMNFEGSDKNTYKGKVPLFNCREGKMVNETKFDTSCGYVGFSLKRVAYDEGKHEGLARKKDDAKNDRQHGESTSRKESDAILQVDSI